jgi:hypothetical protein
MNMHRFTFTLVCCVALLTLVAASLSAQRVAPSGAQRLDVVTGAPLPTDAAAAGQRSHADGAVHGAFVGAAAGALTGIAVYIAAHAFASSQDTQVVTSEDKKILFWWATGAGALAGSAIGAIIGGIAGR